MTTYIDNPKIYEDIQITVKSDDNNYIIRFAYNEGYLDIVNLLWQDQRVKDTLENDDKELYNELIKNDIKDKVEDF